MKCSMRMLLTFLVFSVFSFAHSKPQNLSQSVDKKSLGQLNFDESIPVMPAQAGIQRLQTQASGESAWIPAFAGMTLSQSTSQNRRDRELETATFAGGCFWCMEPPFDELAGVLSTTSGYTGGQKKDPTYEQVSAGGTGHTEAVQVVFDPTKIRYGELLEVFWRNIDPTTPNRQFCDVGSQYRTAIFYHNDEQQRLAEASKKAIEESGRLTKPIVTEIAPASEFYVAEEYHQDYYKKNPLRYKFYRYNCGRDQALEAIWGDGKVTARP